MNNDIEKQKLSTGMKLFIFFILCGSYLISPFIALLFSFAVIGIINQSFLSSLVFGFSLAYPALFYEPLFTDDASRIMYIMDEMRGIPFNELHHWLSLWANDYLNYPIFTSLMYIVARNFQDTVLPFIVAGISYSIIIYLSSKFSNIYKLSLLVKYLTIISSIVWISYLELISGMRFTLACAISLLIICNIFLFSSSIRRKKYWNLIWFIIPLMIHPGVILILIPLIIILLLRQKNNIWNFIILIASVSLLILFFSNFSSQITYVAMLKNRLFSYQSTSFGYIYSPQHIVHFSLALFMGIIASIELNFVKKQNFNKKWLFKNLYILVIIYTMYFFVSIISFTFGMRLAMVMPIIFIFAISSMTSNLLNEKITAVNIILLLVIIISGAVYNFNFFDINLSGIHFFFFD